MMIIQVRSINNCQVQLNNVQTYNQHRNKNICEHSWHKTTIIIGSTLFSKIMLELANAE